MNWSKVKAFVRGKLFCTAAIAEEEGVRLFPIGSLRVANDGSGSYFEIFAKPAREGDSITFLAVDSNPLFWLVSLLQGRFSHPPALRLRGRLGVRRDPTLWEVERWHKVVGLLLKTRGGAALWSKPGKVREVQFTSAEPVRLGKMTQHLRNWV